MKYLYLIGLIVMSLILISCGNDSENELMMDCSKSSLRINEVSTTNAECDSSGSLEVSAMNASGDATFRIDGGSFQTSGVFNVSAGIYLLEAKDNTGCISELLVTVGAEPDVVVIASVVFTDSGCGTLDGSITVSASGGEGNLMYQLDNGSFQTSNVFDELPPNSYTISVKDDVDCVAGHSVQVLTGIRLGADIMPIITGSCQTNNSSCHSASAPRVNLGIRDNVIDFAIGIKSRTQSGNMPKGSDTLTQDEKNLIACWVDDGALDN